MTVLVMVPFLLGTVRYLIVRTGRPAWIRRILARRSKRSGLGAGATVTDELHAFLNANKRVQIERQHEEQFLRDEMDDGAPPRMGIDLDEGKAVFRGDKKSDGPGL
ncbi:hypothetical protein RKD29_006630 [Streptomyces tendae]|uniref:DUF6191 domain-containing protein n=1 Tax=Streptomyces tendae TaxID=1932 RepID=UPI003833C79B